MLISGSWIWIGGGTVKFTDLSPFLKTTEQLLKPQAIENTDATNMKIEKTDETFKDIQENQKVSFSVFYFLGFWKKLARKNHGFGYKAWDNRIQIKASVKTKPIAC